MAGGGWISPPDFLSFYGPNFPQNQSKHGLKWNFASLHTNRNFEKNPRFCSFAVGLHRSELVWKFPVWHENFQKFTIFHVYRQYIHQMKAENILNSNLRRKSTVVYIFFLQKLDFQKLSPLFWWKKNFSNENFSKKFLYNPQSHFLCCL